MLIIIKFYITLMIIKFYIGYIFLVHSYVDHY